MTFSVALRRLRRRLFDRRRYVYYRLDLAATPEVARSSDRVERGRYDLLLTAPDDAASPRAAEGFRQRAERRRVPGTQLYSVSRGGDLAHWGWMSTFETRHRLASLGRDLVVDQPSVFLADFHTEAAHRRNGLYDETIRAMLADAAAGGARYAFIATREGNVPSRRAIERVGFEPYRLFTRVLILGHRFVRAETPDSPIR